MGFKRTAEPAAEPVTTAEAKTAGRISTSSDDTYIGLLLKAAREQVEAFTKRALITQTWVVVLEHGFPWDNRAILLPVSPVQSVSSIAYVDTNGTTQTWSSSNYTVDSSGEQTQIAPVFNQVYPTARDIVNAVTITFVAGFSDTGASVPESYKHAIKMLVSHWYDNRAEFGTIPEAVKNVLTPFRVPVV